MVKRQLFNCLFAGLIFCGSSTDPASAGRGNGRSSQYAAGKNPVTAPADQGNNGYTYGATANDVVEMILKVPATAEVWLNDTKTAPQTKAVRHFVTPALEPGEDYFYDIRVRWNENGKPLEQTRRVLVRAGDRITLNLMDMPRQPAKGGSK